MTSFASVREVADMATKLAHCLHGGLLISIRRSLVATYLGLTNLSSLKNKAYSWRAKT
jgi:hypothetical protein